MTVTKSRAVLAALLLAAAPLALTAAQAQDRESTNSDGGLAIPGRNKPAAKTPALGLSSAVAKPLNVSITALTANKLPDALTAAKEAQGLAKTDYEKGKVNQVLSNIYLKMGDEANAVTAAEAAADTPPDQIAPDDKLQYYYVGAALALNNKHYEKAST